METIEKNYDSMFFYWIGVRNDLVLVLRDR